MEKGAKVYSLNQVFHYIEFCTIVNLESNNNYFDSIESKRKKIRFKLNL